MPWVNWEEFWTPNKINTPLHKLCMCVHVYAGMHVQVVGTITHHRTLDKLCLECGVCCGVGIHKVAKI